MQSPCSLYEGSGRGGIRTHGGFPHARFRVECLKPDSATLPRQTKRRTINVQHSTFDASMNGGILCVRGTANSPPANSMAGSPCAILSPKQRHHWQARLSDEHKKMLQF